MKRTKLCDRRLPDYSRGEELMNMITHIVGGGLGIVVLLTCVVRAALNQDYWGIVSCHLRHYLHYHVYHFQRVPRSEARHEQEGHAGH